MVIPVALCGCLNGIRKRKAMEQLRYKELDTGLYVSFKQKQSQIEGRDTSQRSICGAKCTKNECQTQTTLTHSKLSCTEASEHYQQTREQLSNTNQSGLCRKASPRNLHFLYSRSNRKFSWNTSLKQASSTMKKWPHWVVYASLILREIRVYSTGISSWFSDRPRSCPQPSLVIWAGYIKINLAVLLHWLRLPVVLNILKVSMVFTDLRRF